MKFDDPPERHGQNVDLAALARDWITLWQSELAAMANDRELREAWIGLLALWAGAASSAIDIAQRAARHEPSRATPRRYAGTDGTARPAPGGAAPPASGDPVEHLHRRIAELEARLAALERGGGSG
ncbi:MULTISPECIES: hypothetical protein [Acidiphilium]|uniref:Poly(3-hydroxyalkanoate) polymerase subunit PhaE n=1 Tax=Acidiphilium iwatense TaxID=768198 RepID=A0ABS9DYS4_9PROT|nr:MULTISPECIES: hypothetical protein [Acidiphilium]MCF3947895.1 hypothetical protein [Acidiphilium iwatense]